MGLFDLPSPVFSFLNDHLLAWSPAWLQLLLWSLVTAWLSMGLFKRLSRQEAIAELKKQVKSNQNVMASFDGEMAELLPLIGTTLKLAIRQFGLAVGPALLASIPVVFLLAWLSNDFGHQLPRAGDTLVVEAVPRNASTIQFSPVTGGEASGPGQWHISWPGPDQTLAMNEGSILLVKFPLASATTVIHKRQWWNWLVGNPLGYLPQNSRLDALEFDLPDQRVLNFGPNWMRGWIFTFFAGLVVFSVALKIALKIE